MKLSTMLMYSGNPREAADEVAALEKAGLDTVWVAEAYGFDSPTLMGYLAARTETVEIGAAILNVYSRTPSALAQTAAGLDNVSGGRAILGLGASGPQVIEGWHGIPYDKPLTRTREVVDIVRMALRRERLDHEGKIFSLPLPADQGLGLGKPLKMLTKPERPSVPIYIAALGQKNVEGTAEYADGWLPFMYAPERAKDVWGDALAAGNAKRREGLGPLEVVAGGMVCVGDDVKGMLDFARPMAALYIGGMGAKGKNFYNTLVSQYGFEKEAAQIQEMYLGGNKRDAESVVPLELLEMCNLVGPESYVKERIAAFAEAGVTNLQIVPVPTDGDSAGLVRQMKEWIVMTGAASTAARGRARVLPPDRPLVHREGGQAAPRAVGDRWPGQPRGVDQGRRDGPALLRRRRGVRRTGRAGLPLQHGPRGGAHAGRRARSGLPRPHRHHRAVPQQPRHRRAEAALAARLRQRRDHHRDRDDRARRRQRPAGHPHQRRRQGRPLRAHRAARRSSATARWPTS